MFETGNIVDLLYYVGKFRIIYPVSFEGGFNPDDHFMKSRSVVYCFHDRRICFKGHFGAFADDGYDQWHDFNVINDKYIFSHFYF